MMMRSAVQLIDKLALASVWVPSSIQNPKSHELSNRVEILAAFSKNKEDALVYNNRDHINIHKENLINRIVTHDKRKGLIAKDPEQNAVYIEDVMEESFSRKAVARKIDLVSLYQVPKFNPKTEQIGLRGELLHQHLTQIHLALKNRCWKTTRAWWKN